MALRYQRGTNRRARESSRDTNQRHSHLEYELHVCQKLVRRSNDALVHASFDRPVSPRQREHGHAGKGTEGWQARSEKSLVKQVGCAVQQVHVQEGAACHVDSEASSAPGSLCQTPPAGGIAQHHAPEVHRPRDDGVVVRQPQFDSVDWFRKDPRLLQTRKRTRDPCRA